MSEQKLVKLVYAYDIDQDKIAARHYYDNGECEVIRHTHNEWQELLYGIRTNKQPVEIMTTVEEYMGEA